MRSKSTLTPCSWGTFMHRKPYILTNLVLMNYFCFPKLQKMLKSDFSHFQMHVAWERRCKVLVSESLFLFILFNSPSFDTALRQQLLLVQIVILHFLERT